MEPDKKRIRLANQPPEVVQNQIALLLLLPPELRAKIILEQITDFADLMVIKRVSSDLRDWMQADDIVLRWERKHLHGNDYWRSHLMQKFAFADNVKISIGNGELVHVNFDALFRSQQDFIFNDAEDELDSVKEEFEMTLFCTAELDSPLLTEYDKYFDTPFKEILFSHFREEPNDGWFIFVHRGARIFARRIDGQIQVTVFILNVRKKRMFKFIMHLMQTFQYATFFEDAVVGRRPRLLRANLQSFDFGK